mmetsp:Transcript_23132/g.23342  ORF Transcript_23132/g.23342 Transcript_23132/m.23342 type:complete len:537 (+) Transcript_23132:72-1682(+)
MAEDFDIEAYLEAQVDSANKKDDKGKTDTKERSSEAEVINEEIKPKKEEKHRDRGDRDRDRGRDKERKERDRDRERDRDKPRDRDRDRERRKRSSRSRSREREREREKSREKDRGRREKGRSRSRSRDRDRSRDREKNLEREKEKEKERERERQVSEAEAAAKKEADRQKKEINDLTKDQRTVFVSQLTMKVNEKMINEFFTQIGKVNDVIMIRDKYTGRHKGFAYVEMADLENIPTCLMLNSCVPDFQKFPILVKASEAEKNFLAKKEATTTTAAADNGLLQGADSRLYLGNLHVNVTEDDLTVLLSQFGKVEHVNIQKDELGTSRGYAFVRYSRPEEAQGAFGKLGGLELAGKPIKVGFVNDSSGTGNAQNASANWKLDDDEGVGMQMNAQSRVMLMAKLGQAAGINVPVNQVAMNMASSTPVAPAVSTAKVPPVGGMPSVYFMIRNMFVLEEETSEGWEEDIKEDVADECKRFGAVEDIVVENRKPGGLVFVKFSRVDTAINAANSLNGRWFAGRMILVSFIDATQFAALTTQ